MPRQIDREALMIHIVPKRSIHLPFSSAVNRKELFRRLGRRFGNFF